MNFHPSSSQCYFRVHNSNGESAVTGACVHHYQIPVVGVVCGPAQYPRGAVATAMPFNRKLDGGWNSCYNFWVTISEIHTYVSIDELEAGKANHSRKDWIDTLPPR